MGRTDARDVAVGRAPGRGWVRVTHGLHRTNRTTDLRAWQQLLPVGAAFSHLTAAALHGWWSLDVGAVPVLVDQPDGRPRLRRSGIRVTRVTGQVAVQHLGGLPVTTPAHTLLACARDVALLDLVVLLDCALRAGTSRDEVERVAAGRRRGAPLLRRALGLADQRSESPWETLLRMLHVSVGASVAPQHVVTDTDGSFVARGDLWLRGTRVLHEYDGADHRTPRGQTSDLRRDRALLATGWSRRGYTATDLCHQPVAVLRDVDRSLGRAHRPERIHPWLQLLAASTFSTSGRARLRARLTART